MSYITKPNRRIFIIQSIASASLAFPLAFQKGIAAEKLNPNDPNAKQNGYALNTEDVDQEKYPRHTFKQHCQACEKWNGGNKEWGNCSFFDDALTPKEAWCKSFKLQKS
jgi:hypothetical protein